MWYENGVRAAWFLAALALSGCPRRAEPVQDAAPTAAKEPARKRGVVDTHLHVGPEEVSRLHDIMDEQGIVWGLNLSGMWPGGPLERQLEAAARSGRLLVACNLPWFAASRTEKFPEIAVELLVESKRLGARALKVEKALGFAARSPQGKLLAVDDPWLDPIWKAAGELSLPVVIHTGDPKAFWLPIDEKNERLEELRAHPKWSNYGDPELPSFEALLEQLMNVVAKHRGTTFVAVHFGNNAEDPQWVGKMLDAHPNLYVDLAARLPEIGRHDPKLLHRLFVKHADRILFGTDLGLSPGGFIMLGSIGEEPDTREDVKPFFDKHWRWLETWDTPIPSPTPIQGRWPIHGIGLPDEVLGKIYRENAVRLFGPEPKGTRTSSAAQ